MWQGYITNCGTEGNLHGILVGRENLPDGILYASHETHYSVFKAARMYRMDSVKASLPLKTFLNLKFPRMHAFGKLCNSILCVSNGILWLFACLQH